MANEAGFPNLPHRQKFPDSCCVCLAPTELMHRVSSFGGEAGQSIEAQFDVPMCRACHARMKKRERIVLGIAGPVLAVSFLIITPLSPVPAAVYEGWVAAANGLAFGAALLALFLVVIGRPFEPASYLKGKFRFRNPEYQRQFDQLNVGSPGPESS